MNEETLTFSLSQPYFWLLVATILCLIVHVMGYWRRRKLRIQLSAEEPYVIHLYLTSGERYIFRFANREKAVKICKALYQSHDARSANIIVDEWRPPTPIESLSLTDFSDQEQPRLIPFFEASPEIRDPCPPLATGPFNQEKKVHEH